VPGRVSRPGTSAFTCSLVLWLPLPARYFRPITA
jgi:hypothetical protein